MLLGSIIAGLSDEANIEETLASLDDLVLLARLRKAAAAAGEPLGSFASAAVGNFVAPRRRYRVAVSDGRHSKSNDPGKACLRYILGTELPTSKPSCSCQLDIAPTPERTSSMTTTAERVRSYRGPAILSYGFRPFFLLGAIWAAVALRSGCRCSAARSRFQRRFRHSNGTSMNSSMAMCRPSLPAFC